MCTVIYLPTEKGFILSSNRDENPARQALDPQIVSGNTGTLIFPAVDNKNCSWIGAHSSGHSIVLLNGGFENHQRQSFYRKSRGVILYEMLDNTDALLYWQQQDFENIEPFTLIVTDDKNLHQLVWDGTEKYTLVLEKNQNYLWSSSTLYNPDQKRERTAWFEQWLKEETEKNRDNLLHFLHRYHHNDYGFVMNRNTNLKTLSISVLEIKENELAFNYHVLSEDNTALYAVQNVLKIEK